jgi:hypothetical protein
LYSFIQSSESAAVISHAGSDLFANKTNLRPNFRESQMAGSPRGSPRGQPAEVEEDTVLLADMDDRKTPYIQIGKAGLFHFQKDVLKLGTSKFSAKIQARSRVKYRSKTSYGFLIALSIKGTVTASAIDIENDIKAIKKAIK